MSILDELRSRSSELLIPFQATIELTYHCNERCSHCYLTSYDDEKADPAGRPPLTPAQWKRVLDQLADAGAMVLIFIGGEAMMHPQFWELAEYAAQKNFALSLVTNGLLIDDAAADRMAKLGFYQVSVSVYSLRPEIHDSMTRRKGSHHRSLLAVEKLRSRGIETIINCLLTGENIDSCFELEDWAKERGVRVQFDPMVTARTDGSLPTAERATDEQLERYYRMAKQRGKSFGPNTGLQPEDPVCNAGRGKCAVNAYGDLLTCLEVRESLGNLIETDFHALWNSEAAQRIRGLRNRDLRFEASCGTGSYCDHCPGMAQSESGSPAAEVPFLMRLARIKKKVFEG